MTTNAGQVLEYLDMALDSAQLVSILPKMWNKFQGNDNSGDKQKMIEELIKTGKIKDATEEVLNSWTTGLSGADEMRLLRDVCHLINDKKITPEQGYSFFSFLENAGVKLRTRFREAYITEREPGMRYAVIIVLAQLPDDPQRITFLKGNGLMDPTFVEEITEALGNPFDALGDWAREKIVVFEQKRNERLNAQPPPKRSWWGDMWRFRIFR